MPYFRAILLILVLCGFYGIGVPIQTLARRRGWALSRKIPVFFSQTVCTLLGLRVRFEGENLGPKPRMIVANHVSWSDILVLASRETPCFVAKSEVADWPVLGAFARVQDTIFVRRESRADVPRVNAALARKMIGGEDILLFGEGTSSDGAGVLNFKPSHFAAARDALRLSPDLAEITVQPAAIVYTHARGRKLDANGRRALAWFGDADLAPHIWLLLKSAPIDCVVRFGGAISFNADSDRKVVAYETEQAVRALTGGEIAALGGGDKMQEISGGTG
ncbi:lysophospholipid acyltransferase family protein [Candidatus Rhodoblastus alkanivorans]|uniref:1-acyl-sn-glycerol-3-phosphate acyltransferase n=1 Tax=Candidatus Rhodoblastus alkanivorans TaxID=2954117 RepID=A0ABS9Z1F3_9HYPH|nr:1-acyl-sn-glycerol-3-phosphate acyltransferase [Candidatus Rhodoblastus alkanivorans]MCI4681453.1 1-acyl-sn-glycerol-3-phosphate acyltransferase [Candidatus Rhodoblastus alkanivorans]